MGVLLCVCIILILTAIGNGILRILYGKKQENTFSFADALPMGAVAVTGTAEAAHLTALFAGLSFSAAVLIFAVLTALLFLASLFMIRIRRFERSGGKPSFFAWIFVLLVLAQVVYILAGRGVYVGGDQTVETVESFLCTDAIYQVNPLTGTEFQAGMPLRWKILCLPSLYGALARLFGLQASAVVFTVIPLITLLLCYSAFACLGRCLFPENRKKRECFLAAAALLLWAGNSLLGADGFGVLYCGFRGVVIRNAVLIPYLLSLILRKRRAAIWSCIAAEACIVWTLYGAGACLLIYAVMTALRLAGFRRSRAGGEEVS